MSWTYSGNPANSNTDAVRFLIGDTDCDDKLMLDEEIAHLLATHVDVGMSASKACERIAAKFARKFDTKAGQVSKSLSVVMDHYLTLAKRLAQESNKLVSFYVGGISKDEKTSDRSDTDLPRFNIRLGIHDNPNTDPDIQAEDLSP